ncbi:ImmA/IrrE family metallo-endopeptidase [Eubacteriales bacterium OttesenSCG-928-G02]|nr:ImmA/IrrE family metallo-endopeptidase [Eubacteriales bacterium OttesenSCG-928-G02]
MRANNIDVSNAVWDWIRKSTRLSDENLQNLELWKSGQKQPTFNQLEKFSNNTHIPFGYFFLDNPPEEECKILQYRTVDSLAVQNPSRDLIDTVRQMENIQEWMRDFLLSDSSSPIKYVGSINKTNSVSNISDYVRAMLDISEKWYESIKGIDDAFKMIRDKMSALGIIIMVNGIVGSNTRRSLDIDEFRAFTLIDSYAPLIFINALDSQGGKLFSLLHEFIHVGIGTSSLFNASPIDLSFVDPLESLCNAVAAEILIPQTDFQISYNSKIGTPYDKIKALSDLYKCSIVVIARRAFDSNYIDSKTYFSIVDEAKKGYEQQKIKKKEQGGGGDYYKTNAIRMDHRFLLALDMSLKEGKTLHTDAFRLTNTNRVTFDNLVLEIRGERL